MLSREATSPVNGRSAQIERRTPGRAFGPEGEHSTSTRVTSLSTLAAER